MENANSEVIWLAKSMNSGGVDEIDRLMKLTVSEYDMLLTVTIKEQIRQKEAFEKQTQNLGK